MNEIDRMWSELDKLQANVKRLQDNVRRIEILSNSNPDESPEKADGEDGPDKN